MSAPEMAAVGITDGEFETPDQTVLQGLYRRIKGHCNVFSQEEKEWRGSTPRVVGGCRIELATTIHVVPQMDIFGFRHGASLGVVAVGLGPDGADSTRTHQLWWRDTADGPEYAVRGDRGYYDAQAVQQIVDLFAAPRP